MDYEYFTTQHLQDFFGISHETVKTWAATFAMYLSPTATPEAGRKRLFTPDDVRVFSLVKDFRKRGYSLDDASMALRAGQRGDMPMVDTDITPTAPPALITALRDQMTRIEQQLLAANNERERALGKVELLEKQLAETRAELKELYEKYFDLKAHTKH